MTLQEARERAHALFKKKEEAQREGQKAMQEYRASAKKKDGSIKGTETRAKRSQ
jgi:hypothetical protein